MHAGARKMSNCAALMTPFWRLQCLVWGLCKFANNVNSSTWHLHEPSTTPCGDRLSPTCCTVYTIDYSQKPNQHMTTSHCPQIIQSSHDAIMRLQEKFELFGGLQAGAWCTWASCVSSFMRVCQIMRALCIKHEASWVDVQGLMLITLLSTDWHV